MKSSKPHRFPYYFNPIHDPIKKSLVSCNYSFWIEGRSKFSYLIFHLVKKDGNLNKIFFFTVFVRKVSQFCHWYLKEEISNDFSA